MWWRRWPFWTPNLSKLKNGQRCKKKPCFVRLTFKNRGHLGSWSINTSTYFTLKRTKWNQHNTHIWKRKNIFWLQALCSQKNKSQHLQTQQKQLARFWELPTIQAFIGGVNFPKQKQKITIESFSPSLCNSSNCFCTRSCSMRWVCSCWGTKQKMG